MKKTADAIIIGGGVIGCSVAYHLSKVGMRTLVIEKDYLCAGSTGRCLGGIRQQFSSESSILTAIDSIASFKTMSDELGISVEWHEGGYIFLAHSETQKQAYLEVMKIQRRLGVNVSFVSVAQVEEIVPGINPEGLLGAAYCPNDGQANPFLVVKGYADAVRRLGGEILLRTEVVKVNKSGDRVTSVTTSSGREYHSRIVVNAAGPYAGIVSEMCGLKLPIFPERHEALITEGVEKLFEPMLVDYREDGCYFLQRHSTGQFLGCYTPTPPHYGIRTDTSYEFLTEMPRRMARLVPALSSVSVLRQWAGCYEMTPDGNPLVGSTDVEGFYVACGMCGHGFMFAPSIGKSLAELITSGKTSVPIDEFSPSRRFDKKKEVMK